MLRFRDLGVFVFEFWVLRFRSRVLRFRDLGASCFGLRFRVLRFRYYKNAKKIAEELDLSDRVETMAKRDAFITLKDHKPNFNNALTYRLINPTKSEIGRISKETLQKIVKSVATYANVNLWRNTQSLLEWFNTIENITYIVKQNAAFICFDIVDFYPSITEKLLSAAIDFASEYVNTSPSERQIIMHAKQTLLFSSNAPWVKKDARDGLFDVTMGSYDGAESCELVVVYMLNLLKKNLR